MNDYDLPEVTVPGEQRHVLQADEELRIELAPNNNSNNSNGVVLKLLKGSCELWGLELASGVEYTLGNGCKLALFTWHGCVIQISDSANNDSNDSNDSVYISNETAANVAFVNTHAQLEAMRDEALANEGSGPRVLIVGPPESGKSSLTKVLVAYATKLGRTPLWVDLDPSDNALSLPGTLAVAPITTSHALSVDTFSTTGIPPSTIAPLVLWHSSTKLEQLNLFQLQVTALGEYVNARLSHDVEANASGIIVNTNGMIQGDGYNMILHSMSALDINVVLIMGHDRLYSMLTSHVKATTGSNCKIIKLPRSGGVVSRDASFRRHLKSLAIKKYFYGSSCITNPSLTPCATQIPIKEVTLYKLSSVALSNALLPVGQQQSTEAIQLTPVPVTEGLVHTVLCVCHPAAVQAYRDSGMARDLYASAVAGFCVVEQVSMDMLHLLSPCAGAIPSYVFLVGDVTFME